MYGFRKVVDYCGFQDLGYIGFDFTWCNMQEGENRKYLRLDRAFATLEWTRKFCSCLELFSNQMLSMSSKQLMKKPLGVVLAISFRILSKL